MKGEDEKKKKPAETQTLNGRCSWKSKNMLLTKSKPSLAFESEEREKSHTYTP